MVKPMPPKNAAPARENHVMLPDRDVIFAFTVKNEKRKMPINLPINNPRNIPNELELENPEIISFGKTIAVFAKAKTGRIMNATGLCKKC
jgi:hypothetical protein